MDRFQKQFVIQVASKTRNDMVYDSAIPTSTSEKRVNWGPNLSTQQFLKGKALILLIDCLANIQKKETFLIVWRGTIFSTNRAGPEHHMMAGVISQIASSNTSGRGDNCINYYSIFPYLPYNEIKTLPFGTTLYGRIWDIIAGEWQNILYTYKSLTHH